MRSAPRNWLASDSSMKTVSRSRSAIRRRTGHTTGRTRAPPVLRASSVTRDPQASRTPTARPPQQGQQASGPGRIGGVLRKLGFERALLEPHARHLAGKEQGDAHQVERTGGGDKQAGGRTELTQVERMADQPVRTARHEAP